jgi:DNA-binding NtrC family response regulator
MSILVVDDEKLIRWALKERLGRHGHGVLEAADAREALEALESQSVEVILMDLRLPDRDGLEVLRDIRRREPDLPVIMVTSLACVRTAVEAMRLGAYDYIEKPFNTDDLAHSVNRAVEVSRMRAKLRARLREEQERWGLHSLIARSGVMKEAVSTIRKLAAGDPTTVLLAGESGTGKDAVARAIHYESRRASRPFVTIVCTALQDALFESELFGHEKGAFTDAKERREGLLEAARGGTVFLDEIGDLSLPLQAKLLRVLEDREFRRAGGTKELRVDVRVIAATNRDLDCAVAEGRFREDLFYRLGGMMLRLPPLRERREDILPLAEHYLRHYARETGRDVADFSPGARAKLEAHGWPGNVRELRNAVERAVLVAAGPILSENDLLADEAPPRSRRLFELPSGGLRLDELEKALVAQALERSGGNKTRAGELLGMTREQIQYRIEKYALAGTAAPRIASA